MKTTDKDKWQKLAKIIGFTPPLDGLLSSTSGNIQLDIIKLDKLLDSRDHNYNADKCTYKDKTDISPAEYVQLRFGDEAVELIKDLL